MLFSLSTSALTPNNLRMSGSQNLGLILIFTCSQMQESNPGWLGEKHKRYLCAMLPPHKIICDKFCSSPKQFAILVALGKCD